MVLWYCGTRTVSETQCVCIQSVIQSFLHCCAHQISQNKRLEHRNIGSDVPQQTDGCLVWTLWTLWLLIDDLKEKKTNHIKEIKSSEMTQNKNQLRSN